MVGRGRTRTPSRTEDGRLRACDTNVGDERQTHHALPSPIEKILVKEFCDDSIYDYSQAKVDDTHCTHILYGLR